MVRKRLWGIAMWGAAASGHEEACTLLAEHNKCDISAKDCCSSARSLTCHCQFSRADRVQLGTSTSAFFTIDGQTQGRDAAGAARPEIVSWLRRWDGKAWGHQIWGLWLKGALSPWARLINCDWRCYGSSCSQIPHSTLLSHPSLSELLIKSSARTMWIWATL